MENRLFINIHFDIIELSNKYFLIVNYSKKQVYIMPMYETSTQCQRILSTES